MSQSNGYLRYILNELLDEDGDGIPDRRGIPRTPGMSLGAPSGDERMDDYLGIDQPELDQFAEEDYDASPLDQFLERFAQGGVPQGLQQPRGFGQGLVSGIAQGAVGRGQRVGERRKKFEQAQTLRSAERDKANLQATRDLANQRAAGKREEIRGTRAERAKRVEYERSHPLVTAKTLAEMPWLARAYKVGDRADAAHLIQKPEKSAKGERERIVAIEGPNGPVYVRESEAVGAVPAKGSREGNRPPSAGERDQLTGDLGLLDQINQVREAYKGDFVGPAAGRLGSLRTSTGIGRKEGESNFRGRLAAIRNQILKLRSGGAVTEGEAQRLLEELPTTNDPDKEFNAKLNAFEDVTRNIAQARREILQGTGVDVSRVPALPGQLPRSTEMVRVRAPNGKIKLIPPGDVRRAVAAGGTVINGQ